MKLTASLSLIMIVFPGCVNVSLGGHERKQASGVNYSVPKGPFVKDSRSDVDAAWINPKNGNLISFLSDCQDETDPSLTSIVDGTVNGLSELKVESNSSPTVQDREASARGCQWKSGWCALKN